MTFESPPGTAMDLFNDALALEPQEREAFLAEMSREDRALGAELRSLLKVHEEAASSSFLTSFEGVVPERIMRAESGRLLVGERIGSYDVIDVLGEGGMGMVYLAEQEHPHRTVALKIVKPGLINERMLRRFEYEAELLGRLQHPGIAHIYEAGTAEMTYGPQPFFAMELVRGKPINVYVREHDLTIDRRLELMARVCDAVHHAHQKGVIHRDLKPGNILVTEPESDDTGAGVGQPKILDFGVARAAAGDVAMTTLLTDTGHLVGTLQYMSPEQCEGDPNALDTRSDIYSLGVVCYQLLTGSLPYDVDRKYLPEAVRVIHDKEPKSLSSINRRYRGDVDRIVGKAIEKERERRYASAAEFGADIRRYLNGEPVRARRVGPTVRVMRWVRRNRRLAATISIAAVLILTATTIAIVTSTAHHKAEAARLATLAERRADLLALLEQQPGDLQASVVEAALADVDVILEDHPHDEFRARIAIGTYYRTMSEPEAAERQFRIAAQLCDRLGPGHEHERAKTLHNIGAALYWQNRYVDARTYYEQAYEMRRRLAGDQAHPDVAETADHLAAVAKALGEYEQAERLFQEAHRVRSVIGDPLEIAKSDNNLGTIYLDLGRYQEAETLFSRALATAEAQVPRNTQYIARARHNLGRCFMLQERYAEAWERLSNARTLKEARGNWPSYASTCTVMAELKLRQGALAAALDLVDEALEHARPRDRPEPWRVKGLILIEMDAYEKAEEVLRQAQADRANPQYWQLPEHHPLKATINDALAWSLTKQHRFDEARQLAKDAWSSLRRTLGETHPDAIAALRHLVELNRMQAAPDGSGAEYEALLERVTRAAGPT